MGLAERIAKMKLYHSTLDAIKEIHGRGPYGSHLFFSDFYQQTRGNIVYVIEIADEELVEAWQIFDHEVDGNMRSIVAEVRDRVEYLLGELPEDFDDWDAEQLLKNTRQLSRLARYYDLTDAQIEALDEADAGEVDWEIQRLTAEAARIAGFKAVQIEDEMGESIMIDMLGREGELRIVEEDDEEAA